jgi:TolB-like protein/AraC-like DNA-binding protein/Tfp pilus assembly protein PilF
MVEHHFNNQGFIQSLVELIEINICNENFGAKELAEAAGMSQRKLSFKLRTIRNSSVSRFICETRLQKALEILQNEDITAAEVAYKVGFGSATYFNKCFHEFFGYPPGKIRKEKFNSVEKLNPYKKISGFLSERSFLKAVTYAFGGLIFISALLLVINYTFIKKSSANAFALNSKNLITSIAILPLENLSDSTANQYFIDGVMEEILTSLSQIHDLRVVSRSSVEQFRGSRISTSEIAKKLKVDYLLIGSGQKYGNRFRLRVQLIETSKDRQIWAKPYEQEISEPRDIFKIQSEVAQSVASELKATITPEEKRKIEKIPTTNLTAYDYYQRGNEEFSKYPFPYYNKESLKKAEILFHKAVECDSTFAQAYVGLAYVLWKRWDHDNTILGDRELNNYIDSMLVLANKALSLDDQLPQAYIVRGEYYSVKGSVEQALEEWNTGLKYNPNEGAPYGMIGGMYEELDIVASLENLQKAAFLQHGPELTQTLTIIGLDYYKAGFPEKGNYFFLETLKLDEDSVKYADNIINSKARTMGDYKKAVAHFERRYVADSTNEEILLLLGYYNSLIGNNMESLKHYRKYLSAINDINVYNSRFTRYARLGYAYFKCGFNKEADYYFNKQIETCKTRLMSVRPGEKIYWLYPLAGAYACQGDKDKAYENLRIFNKAQSFTLEWVTLLKTDPIFQSIRNEPEFQKIVKDVEAKYKAEHERVIKWIEGNRGLSE